MKRSTSSKKSPTLTTLMSVSFVFLWSTGFIGAKIGSPYIEPLTFLLYRYGLTIGVLIAILAISGVSLPRDLPSIGHLVVTGILFHVVYLGGVFTAISIGVPAGVVALITALQPLLTAIISDRVVGERISRRQWIGLFLGFVGVALVLNPAGVGRNFFGYVAAVTGTLGITIGTLYQKKFCARIHPLSSMTVQFTAAFIVLAALAPLVETMKVQWNSKLVLALGLLVIVTSLGSYTLMFILIRLGSVTRVASLLYLTPAITMLMAFWLHETLSGTGIWGLVISTVGVALASRESTEKVK